MIDWGYLASLDFASIWTYREALLKGLVLTLVYTSAGTGLGVVLGVAVAICSQSPIPPLRWLVATFVELFRNTPLLVQLIWIHFALPGLTGLNTSVLESGLIAIALNGGAYFSEIVRAGVEAVDRRQWEAARSLALLQRDIWRYVILPQAIRVVLPPLANMTISLLKGTAVLSILSIGELMRVTARISTYTAKPVEIFTFAALVYFFVGIMITWLFSRLERRMSLPE